MSADMSTRLLRSKRHVQPSNLFDFDGVNEYVHKDKPLKVLRTTYTAPEPEPAPHTMPVPPPPPRIITSKSQPRKSKLREDPLDDAVYESFHRYMCRQEARMATVDRSKLLADIDVLETQRAQLETAAWPRHLPSITKINNLADRRELAAKRALTLAEIQRRLAKFRRWQKHVRGLKSRRAANANGDDALADYDVPVAELRRRRIAARARESAAPIRLVLHNGFYILMSTTGPPKVIKESPPPLQGA